MSVKLIRYDAARHALQVANSVDEVKDIRDKAQAMAAYARQANDTALVEWATEIKVRAERRAGELLVANGVKAGNPQLSHGSTIAPKLAELGISRNQSSRWQKLAAVPEDKFEQAVAAAKEIAGEVTTAAMLRIQSDMAVHYSSATPEWETPADLFDALDEEFGFDLDVCATQQNAKCARFYSTKQNGLQQEWRGACWMNPPYGDVIAEWVSKAHQAAVGSTVVVCLVPARVDTVWWWEHCRFAQVRFLRGRLKFGSCAAGAPFPSAVVIFGLPPETRYWEWRTA